MRGKVLSRREFVRVCVMGAGGATLAACSPQKAAPTTKPSGGEEPVATKVPEQPAPTVAPQEGVTIEYWFAWAGHYGAGAWDAMRETEEFKEALGNNTLETKGSVSSEAFLTAVAAGTPPDGASNVDYVGFMSRGVLLPIDDWMAASTVYQKEDHLEDVWNNGSYKGKMYGAPANENFVWYGLIYNSKLVEEAGLEPDNPPVTWPELLEWHKTLTTFDDAGNLLAIGLDPYDCMAGEPDFPSVSWGWTWFDEEAGTHDLDNDLMAEALNTMGEFYKIVGPDNMSGFRQVEGQGGWGGAFDAGVQAMMIDGYWAPGRTVNRAPETGQYVRASWAPVPENRRGHKLQGAGGHYVIFFKDAKNPEAMFKIAEFLNTDIACQIIFENAGWLPSRKSFISQVDPNTYPGLEFYLTSVSEATDWLRYGRRSPIRSFIQTQFNQLREAVYRDQMKADDAVAELQRRADAEWEAQGLS